MKAKHERAARAWRTAPPTDAWKRFRAFVARHADDEENTCFVPHWSLRLQFTEAWTGPKPSRLLVFQKRHAIETFIGPGPVSRAEKLRVATVLAPFAPRAFDTALLRAHVKLVGGPPLGFVGDLSPYGVHLFGALRSGDLSAPRLDRRAPLDLQWLGVDDSWLRRADTTTHPHRSRRVTMGWFEREYWGVVKRLLPGIRGVIGVESFALLEDGCTLEIDSFNDVLPDALAARLRRMTSRRKVKK